MAASAETGRSSGSIPVDAYSLRVERSGLSGTAELEVTEGETTEVTVTLR